MDAVSRDTVKVNLSKMNVASLSNTNIASNTNELYLDNNQLLYLPQQVCNLHNIKILSIASQLDIDKIGQFKKPALQELPDSLRNLTELIHLNVHNNALQTLPNSIGVFRNLQVLDLRMNLIRDFPDVICEITSLKVLQLCGNSLSLLPRGIHKLCSLKEFTIKANRLCFLPDEICSMKSLHILALQNNRIRVLPRDILQLENLSHRDNALLLDGNPLQYPPQEIVRLGTQRVFDYLKHHSNDQWSKVRQERHASGGEYTACQVQDDTMVDLTGKYGEKTLSARHLFKNFPEVDWMRVQQLNVSANEIKAMDVDFETLGQVTTLIIDQNHMVDKFPLEPIKRMKQLRKLSLNAQSGISSRHSIYGSLASFPTDLIHVNHLTHLHMSKNGLRAIPRDIKFMVNLVELDLVDNRDIREVPDEIGELTKLQYLGLSGNRIETLPNAIGRLIRMRVLRLSCNRLQYLPEEICELQHLMTLTLTSNRLVYLPLSFDRLSRLASTDSYKSQLFDTMVLQSRLMLDRNENIKFPSSNCHEFCAQELFQEYAHLRKQGNDAMMEAYEDAKKDICEVLETTKQGWHLLDDRVFGHLSKTVAPSCFKQLGIELNLTQIEVDHCRENNPHRFKDAVSEMLRMWRNRRQARDEEAMVRELQDAMIAINDNELKDNFTRILVRNRGWQE